jgi:hypothetical protein
MAERNDAEEEEEKEEEECLFCLMLPLFAFNDTLVGRQ